MDTIAQGMPLLGNIFKKCVKLSVWSVAYHCIDCGNLFSPLGKPAKRAIYFADVFFLFFNIYFNGRLFSEGNGPIFKISGLVDGWKGLFTSFNFFSISQ